MNAHASRKSHGQAKTGSAIVRENDRDRVHFVGDGGAVLVGERYTYADLFRRLTDLQRLATPVVPGEKTFASTSHDRGMSYDSSTDMYRKPLVGLQQRPGLVVIQREGPEVLGWDVRWQVDPVGLGPVKSAAVSRWQTLYRGGRMNYCSVRLAEPKAARKIRVVVLETAGAPPQISRFDLCK